MRLLNKIDLKIREIESELMNLKLSSSEQKQRAFALGVLRTLRNGKR